MIERENHKTQILEVTMGKLPDGLPHFFAFFCSAFVAAFVVIKSHFLLTMYVGRQCLLFCCTILLVENLPCATSLKLFLLYNHLLFSTSLLSL